MTINITITRGDDWETSYDVWGKRGSIPLEEGDGFFIGNYPIGPDEDSITVEWTGHPVGSEYDGYGFLVVPITQRSPGPYGVFSP